MPIWILIFFLNIKNRPLNTSHTITGVAELTPVIRRKLPNWRIQSLDSVPLSQTCREIYGEPAVGWATTVSIPFFLFHRTDGYKLECSTHCWKNYFNKNLVIIIVHIKYTLYWVGPEKYGFYLSQIICNKSFFQQCAEIPEYGCFLPTLSSHVPIE